MPNILLRKERDLKGGGASGFCKLFFFPVSFLDLNQLLPILSFRMLKGVLTILAHRICVGSDKCLKTGHMLLPTVAYAFCFLLFHLLFLHKLVLLTMSGAGG